MAAKKMFSVKQIASPRRRVVRQAETLKGLGLRRIGQIVQVEDTPATRGMVAKIPHLVAVVEQ